VRGLVPDDAFLALEICGAPDFDGALCRANEAAEKLMGIVILRSRQAVLSIAKEESAFAGKHGMQIRRPKKRGSG
jgi:hypothetical protein